MSLQLTRPASVMWPVPNLDAAIAFYTESAGCELSFSDGERYAALKAGGTTVHLVSGPEDITEGNPALTLRVDDVAAAVATLRTAGATVVTEPTAGPHEIRAVLRDPNGQWLVVHSPL
ncbi:VOC family protein [Nocardioides sp. Bht2]|uniref:VOC family protein n=1 Tax=Nocardioides sp. Bht2 TaxID=3392297 RepID=UPI0039B56989